MPVRATRSGLAAAAPPTQEMLCDSHKQAALTEGQAIGRGTARCHNKSLGAPPTGQKAAALRAGELAPDRRLQPRSAQSPRQPPARSTEAKTYGAVLLELAAAQLRGGGFAKICINDLYR